MNVRDIRTNKTLSSIAYRYIWDEESYSIEDALNDLRETVGKINDILKKYDTDELMPTEDAVDPIVKLI